MSVQIVPVLKAGTVIAGTFQVIRILGLGGEGVVYQCRHLKSSRDVALKTCFFDGVNENSTLQYEAAVLRKLKDQGPFPRAYKYGSDKLVGLTYISMTLFGRNLEELKELKKDKRLPLEDVLKVGLQGLEALRLLHGLGLLHSDIKPGNFVLDKGKTVVDQIFLVDFGVSSQFRTKLDPSETKTEYVGTLTYSSPFVLAGLHKGRRDDLYSLLYVLVELAKGKLPWKWKSKGLTLENESRRLAKFGKKKLKISDKKLLQDLPFKKFLAHLKELEEMSEPNYELIKSEFLENLNKLQPQTPVDFRKSPVRVSPRTSPTIPTPVHVIEGPVQVVAQPIAVDNSTPDQVDVVPPDILLSPSPQPVAVVNLIPDQVDVVPPDCPDILLSPIPQPVAVDNSVPDQVDVVPPDILLSPSPPSVAVVNLVPDQVDVTPPDILLNPSPEIVQVDLQNPSLDITGYCIELEN